jgi:RHS repeat-associated protein
VSGSPTWMPFGPREYSRIVRSWLPARFFTTDHLGSTTEVSATMGTVQARYAFDPWGRRTLTVGTDVTRVGFTGHQLHAPAELVFALYRGYRPDVGRWLSSDPSRDGVNHYEYVANNPVSANDPEGLAGIKLPGVVGQLLRGHRAIKMTNCVVSFNECANAAEKYCTARFGSSSMKCYCLSKTTDCCYSNLLKCLVPWPVSLLTRERVCNPEQEYRR